MQMEVVKPWIQKMGDLLAGNRVVVGDHRYTAPSLDTGDFGRKDYANQFLWDTCFHAVSWRWIDPVMAQDELLSLVSRQVADGPDAGMIPHCNYWRGGGSYLWGQDDRSSITQPPLIASAARLVYERSGSREFLQAIYEPVRAYHDWFDRRRDPDGDGLVTLIHPWESGGDALTRWDKPMKVTSFTHESLRSARHELAHVVATLHCDAQALAEAGWYSVEPMDYNAIRAADMEAMGYIAGVLGKPEDVEMWGRRVEVVRRAFQSKMIVEGRPYDLDGLDEQPIVQDSAGQLVTLFGGMVTPEQAETLVSQLREARFWTTYPVPTTPTDSPKFAPDTYWRGNVWASINWLIYQGLRRYGYIDLADELAARSLALLEQSGFCEYYHPLTGQGLGGTEFGWSSALVEIAAESAAASAD